MMERKHLEKLLRVNGLAPDSVEEDIRSVLSGASLNEHEITSALTMLHEQNDSAVMQESGSYKLFRSGEALQPGEISQLLGVNLVVKEVIFADFSTDKMTVFSRFMVLWLTSVLLAAIALSAYMYMHKIGLFHPAMEGMSLLGNV